MGVIDSRLCFEMSMSHDQGSGLKTREATQLCAKDFMAKVDTSVIGTKYNKGCLGRFLVMLCLTLAF